MTGNAYPQRLKNHLARYARETLGVTGSGTWRGRSYAHILPEGSAHLNLAEAYRGSILAHVTRHGIRLHDGFGHLNSSQAFAFNLFLPYLTAGETASRALADALGVSGPMRDWALEAIPDPEEQTNIDVLWRTDTDVAVYCEVKLSETGFGTARPNPKRLDHLERIYRPRLTGLVSADLLDENRFFDHYQLLRNLYHMAGRPRDRLLLLFPRANTSLMPQIQAVRQHLAPEMAERMQVAYSEDVLARLQDHPALTAGLRSHAEDLVRKYVPLADPGEQQGNGKYRT